MSSVELTKSTSTILEMYLSKELEIYLSNPKLSKELKMNTDESIKLREQSVDDLLLHVEVGDQPLTEYLLDHLNIKQNLKNFFRNVVKKIESDLRYIPLKQQVKILFLNSGERGTGLNVKGSVRENERGFRLNAIKKRF